MAQITPSLRRSALRRGMLIAPDARPAQPASDAVRYAAVLELANLGFVVSPGDLNDFTAAALKDSIEQARTVIGADRDMEPIYPGFPEQVEALSTTTLLVEQLLHYWTGGTFLPDHPTVVREGLPLEDMLRSARALSVSPATEASERLIEELVGSPVALSEADRELLVEAVAVRYSTEALRSNSLDNFHSIAATVQGASNAENIQIFVEAVLKRIGSSSKLTRHGVFSSALHGIRTVDGLLRVILSVYTEASAPKWQANYELAVGTLADRHFRAVSHFNIPRTQRRELVAKLGELTGGFHADRLVARQNLWRGALRTAHPYDLKLSDAARRAADIVHGNIEYRTLNSLVEEAMENGDGATAAKLLAEHQPGNLLRRLVAILRITSSQGAAESLAEAVARVGSSAALTTLISSYNGVLSANDDAARVTRVAGLTNTMQDRSEAAKIDPSYQAAILGALDQAMVSALRSKAVPSGPVAVGSELPVPLVRRDASTADRVLDRGQELALAGSGDTLRIFGHWNNNQSQSGYMDIGAVVLDGSFEQIAVTTWDSWADARSWSTYSGDMLVYPGDSAAEFIDLKLTKLRELFPTAEWVAMTVQSWSGFPMGNVDFIAGAMLRSEAQKGQVFDPRSVTTAFKPTTQSTQSVPFAVNLKTGKLVWIDSSNGSTESGVSSTGDETIGAIVYDEIARPRLTLGRLAELWAQAHGASTVDGPADRDALLELL